MNTRIKSISDAATLLFLRQGYARTQVSHIAKAIGVSVGTIYLDFAGKKEIMHFVLKSMIDPGFSDREFKKPITDDIFKDIENEVVSLLKEIEYELTKPFNCRLENYSFEDLISDAFDLLARYAVGSLFIEKNQYDFKFLAEQYKIFRRSFFDIMKSYISAFIDNGMVRRLEYLELSITMIIEILSWWAMDRRFISFETSDISLELAKKICMDNIISAYKQ